jgi:hypothetical protein
VRRLLFRLWLAILLAGYAGIADAAARPLLAESLVRRDSTTKELLKNNFGEWHRQIRKRYIKTILGVKCSENLAGVMNFWVLKVLIRYTYDDCQKCKRRLIVAESSSFCSELIFGN